MAEAKIFNNVILGQFVLSGVPIKVYTSGRFLTLTDTDDVEDPRIGFGMDEDGAMIQFTYPEVEFLSVQGNKVDIETYNKGMAKIHGGDEAPADAEAEEDEAVDEKPDAEDLKDNLHMIGRLLEASKEEIDATIKAAELDIEGAKEKEKASKISLKNTMKKAKEKIKAAKSQPIEEHQGYTFGTGDVIQNTNPGCVHFGSKGIVISQNGNMIRYTVTNGTPQDTYRPGDILTKTSDQLEVYK